MWFSDIYTHISLRASSLFGLTRDLFWARAVSGRERTESLLARYSYTHIDNDTRHHSD